MIPGANNVLWNEKLLVFCNTI